MANDELKSLLLSQRDNWSLVEKNFKLLNNIKQRSIFIKDIEIKIQFNPARAISSTAKVDAKSIAKRKCFLCQKNRPDEQLILPYSDDFDILVNPFPILRQHFTVVNKTHRDQEFILYLADILGLSEKYHNYTFFYNGPKCGASAPDHMHFQAGDSSDIPFVNHYENNKNEYKQILKSELSCAYSVISVNRQIICFESSSKQEIYKLVNCVNTQLCESFGVSDEPMYNILVFFKNGKYIVNIFLRAKHRPNQYFFTDEKQILISPGALDMAGLIITVRETDFNNLSQEDVLDIFNQMSIDKDVFCKLENKISTCL